MGFYLLAVLFFIVAVIGGLFAATPCLMPRSECFAVTIPASAAADPALVRIRRAYIAVNVAATVLMLAALAFATVGLALGTYAQEGEAEAAFTVCYTLAIVFLFVVSIASYLVCRARVRRVKAEKGWRATTSKTSVAVAGPAGAIRLPGLAWCALFVVPVGVALVVSNLLYPSMPAELPVQADLFGNVARTVAKTRLAAIGLPALICAFFAIVFTVSIVAMRISKRNVNPDAPQASARAYLLFARAQARTMFLLGVSLELLVAVLMPLSMANVVPLVAAAFVMLAYVVLALVVVIRLSAVYGQSGARLLARWNQEPATSSMPQDADARWLLGTIYVNRDDPSVVVPKRFGIGWSLNMAHPASWLALAALVVLVVAFVWIISAIA